MYCSISKLLCSSPGHLVFFRHFYFSRSLFPSLYIKSLWWLWIQTTDSHEVDNNGPHALHGNTIYFPLHHQCTPHNGSSSYIYRYYEKKTGASSLSLWRVRMSRFKQYIHIYIVPESVTCAGSRAVLTPLAMLSITTIIIKN